MNKTLSITIVILCIITLAVSYVHWQNKLDSVRAGNSVEKEAKKPSEQENDKLENEGKIDDKAPLLSLLANQNEQVKKVFQNRIESDDDLNFLIIGSSSMTHGEPGYADRLTIALNNAYGDFINITTATIEGTTAQFITEDSLADVPLTEDYDIILFEPLTLNNNGIVTTEDEHLHIKTFREQMTAQVPDSVLILHPPQPLYAATYYPEQVKLLQSFAEAENIPYVNHWVDWPEKDNEELKEFLTDDSTPNSDGAEIWANALINYFIAK